MRCRRLAAALVLAAAPTLAQTPAASPSPAPAPAADAAPKMELALGGFYEFNGYSQNNFFLGKGAPGGVTDDDAYMIQLFRVQPVVSYGKAVRGVLSIDIAQSIFGLDDEQRDNDRAGFTNQFNKKDTNFLIHVDNAYVEFSPEKLRGFTVRLGRMRNDVGQRLVIDQDGDGVQVARAWSGDKVRLTLNWTKQFEGADSLTDARFDNGLDGRDADLLYADLAVKAGSFTLDPYVAFYSDRGWRDGTAFLPQGLQYNLARFQPQVTRALALGVAWDGKIGRASVKGEGAFLTGEDEIDNPHSGANQLLDVNDGDLRGFVLYGDVKLPVGKGTLGALVGIGSGDSDPMSGDGNLTRIKTQGFFYVTEVWEDSVMPDEQGITPQGLGSPGSRGYRELENTTLAQLNYTRPIAADWTGFVSATLIRATEAVRPWSDADGDGFIEPGELGADGSKDLGTEIDAKIDWKLLPSLTWTLRGGVMLAGDAAGYLVNGTSRFDENPWELRTTVRFNFSGLKLQ